MEDMEGYEITIPYCNHRWEFINHINNVKLRMKYAMGEYVVFCPECGSIGSQQITGAGLRRERVAVSHQGTLTSINYIREVE